MIDIDWSKAPEDCIGAVQSHDDSHLYPHGHFVKSCTGFDNYAYCGEEEAYPCMEYFQFIPRPQPKPVYTQIMYQCDELPVIGMIVKHQSVNKIVMGEIDPNNNLALKSINNKLYSLAHIDDIEPITPPIELIDGKAYQFDYHSGKGVHGIYHKPDEDGFAIFKFVGGAMNKELVTNIKPLTVEPIT